MPIPFPASSLLPSLQAAAVVLAFAGFLGTISQARALSDTLPEYVPGPEDQTGDDIERIPLPDPAIPAGPADGQPAGDAMRHDPDQDVPEVLYDPELLPEPVQRLRRLILEASRSGDPERLRPLIGTRPDATQLTLGALEGDPIEFLREISGDEGGQEILAILLEVMESGFVRLNEGTEQELYVWPYFFALPLDELTPEQRVELFTLVTAGDYEEMKSFGAYIFYRAAITPEGRWVYFVAGD